MAILTTSGRTAMAIAIAAQPLHLAWGSGNAAWDDAPVSESIEATALVSEIGRRAVTLVQFCLPAPDGELVLPSGRFAIRSEPTNHLYRACKVDCVNA